MALIVIIDYKPEGRGLNPWPKRKSNILTEKICKESAILREGLDKYSRLKDSTGKIQIDILACH